MTFRHRHSRPRFVNLLAGFIAVLSMGIVSVGGPATPANAAGAFDIDVCFVTGVHHVVVTFAGLSGITITGPGCVRNSTGSSSWTSGNKSVSIAVYATTGYGLPTQIVLNSSLCMPSCWGNNNAISSGLSSYTYTGTATYLLPSNGSYQIDWMGSGSLLASAPTVTSTSTVSGTVTAGQTLTGSATFTGGPTPSENYQWYRCTGTGAAASSVPADCTLVSGATSTTYALTAADAGYYMRYASTASNASGSVTSVSAATSAVTMPAATAVDLTTASDTGSSTTDNLTGDTTPNITVTGLLTGSLVTVTATKTGQTPVTCTFSASGTSGGCDLGALIDGTWAISAVQSSNGVSSSATASLNVTVDSAAPSAPAAVDLTASSDTGASSTDNITNDNTPNVSAAGAVSGETVTVTATKSGSSPVTCTYTVGVASACDLGTLADGTWSVSAAVTDAAGNASPAGTPLDITVDTTAPSAPDAPDLATASDSGTSSTDNITNDSTPTITGAGGSAGETVTITAAKSGSTSVTCSYVVGAATGCDLGTLADGTWSITEKITDLAGNQSAAGTGLSITVDTTAPSAPGTSDLVTASDTGSSSTDNATSDTTPAVSATGGTAGDTVTMTATKGVSTYTCTYVVGSASSCDLPALTDGTWTVSGTLTDPAGNTSVAGTSVSMTIDTTAPAAPVAPDLAAASDSGVSSTDNITNDSTPTITGAGGSAGETVTVTAAKSGSTSVTCSYVVGAGTGCDLGTLADGTWSITETITDTSGNVSPSGSALSITVDTTAPTVVLTSTPVAGSLAGQPTLSMTATFSETVTGFSSTVDVTKAGTSTGWTVGASSGTGDTYTYSVTPSSATSGTITQTVAAGAVTDLAGNSSTVSPTWTATLIGAAPVNTATPSISGTVVGGSTLTATTGTWNDQGDNSPTTAYKWQYWDSGTSQWVDIAGAASSTFVIPDTLNGKALRVGTLRTNVVGPAAAGYAFSTQTAAVTLPPAVNSVVPAISGTVATGSTLTASTGTWSGSQDTYTYQWKLNGSNIAGATAATYAVAAGDLTGTLSVTVTATNGTGGTPVSASSVGTPSRPVITTVTPGNGTMSVAFTAGATNGSTVTGYEASATVNGTTVTQSCAGSPCLMTGLTGGTQYAFTVRPLTATVNGPYSLPVNGTPTAAAPSAPVLDSAVAASAPNTATVAFTPGATNGSTVSGYRITATPASGAAVTVTCAASPCDVPGLTVGITYTFSIAAVANVSGTATTSVASANAPQVTLPVPATTTTTTPPSTTTTTVAAKVAGPATTATGLPVPVQRIEVPVSRGSKNVPVTAEIGGYPATKAPTHVVFVVKDMNGRTLSTVKVPLPAGEESVSAVLPNFPKGATVSAHTVNKLGDGGGVRIHTSVVHQPSKTVKRTNKDGRPILAGLKISDPVYFLATLDNIDSPTFGKANMATLNKVIAYMKGHGGQILVTGFARQNGTDSAGVLKALSYRRSRNVSNYLADHGVRVWIRFDGFGAASKDVGGPTDRRVDIRWVSDSFVVG